jgi:hypothetical protein
MNDQALKAAVERFLKKVSFTAQHEIEKAVRKAVANGKLGKHETWTTAVTLSSEKVGLDVTICSTIKL